MYNKFMFQRIECSKCHESYDELERNCPNCNEPNPNIYHGFWGSKVIALPIWKQIALFIIGWLGFQLLGGGISLIFSRVASVAYTEEAAREAFLKSATVNGAINFIAYLFLFVLFIVTLWKDIKKVLLSFKKWIIPVAAVLGWVTILVFNLIYNTVLAQCGISISDNDNEQTLNKIIGAYPLISLLVFGLIGPLCEELTYRLGLYSFLRRINVVLAFVVTMFVFALIHFDWRSIGTDAVFNELLNLPFYFCAAFVFTFIYEKCGFAAAFTCHAMNNVFSVVATIINNLMNK